ncbi:hypothetical protein ACIQ6Y_33340 [Streptomyces sp. NPDC096205]|uniref:hypothetical protein n=1 Tax=Streptomyces sp. NPDC096205 TaxID=3366081 RepID=UPI003819E750
MTAPIHSYDRYDEPDQLRDQLRRLLRHRAVIALGVALGLLGGAVLALSGAHTYTSTSEVLVRSTADPYGMVSVSADNQVSMGTERQIAASAAVAVRAARILGQADSAAALEDDVRITNQTKSQVLRFEFTAGTPTRAARGANAFAEAYLADRKARNEAAARRATRSVEQQIKTVEAAKKQNKEDEVTKAVQSQLDTLQERIVEINSRDTDGGDIVRRGEAPARPSGPGWPTLLTLGLAAGLALGILLAWLHSALDTRVRSAADARAALGGPVLGLLPRRRDEHEDDALLTVGHRGGDRAETLRALAYRLRRSGTPADTGRILVVAPRRDAATEGVAVNLAAAFAECGEEVLLVDTDPDTPSLTTRLPLLPDDARTPAEDDLPQGSVLVDAGTAGRFACCSTGGSGSPAPAGVSATVDRLPTGFDARTAVVVSRPLLDHADALAIAQRVDAVLLVVALDTTRRDDLQRVRELIDCSGGTLLGAVLDAGHRPGRLRGLLRRRPGSAEEAEATTPVVELPAQDDTLSASRG